MLVPTLCMNLSFFLSKAWVQQALTKKLGTFGVIGKKKISKFGKDMHEFLVMVTTGFFE